MKFKRSVTIGAPAWDPDFNTADFLTLLRISEIGDRYARHFMAD